MLVVDRHMIVAVTVVAVAPFGTVAVVAFFVIMIVFIVTVLIVVSISFLFLIDGHRYQVDVFTAKFNIRRSMAVATMVLSCLVGIARHRP